MQIPETTPTDHRSEVDVRSSGESSQGTRLAPGAPAPRDVENDTTKKRKPTIPQRRDHDGKKKRHLKEWNENDEKEAERVATSLRGDVRRLQKVAEAAEAKAAKLRTALAEELRSAAIREARDRRRALGTAALDLGRPSFGDSWEEGDIDRQLRQRASDLVERKEHLDKLRKTNAATLKEARNGNSSTFFDAVAEDEAVKARQLLVKKDESELANDRFQLDRRRLRHVRDWHLMQQEDVSKYRSRPVLAERYVLLSLLGKGGFSEVWKAYDLDEPGPRAIKFHQLDPTWSLDRKKSYVRHAAREYSISRDLDHPRVVKLHDVFEVDDTAFATVLEYCPGDDLDLILRSRKCLPEKEARAVTLQVLAGLAHLHTPTNNVRGAIIHYDLKPGNILFDGVGRVKISDFGLSKIIPATADESTQLNVATSLELTSQGAGTYHYLPPECFQDAPRITPAVDVWAVGVILYQMLFGARPFGEGLSQHAHRHTMLTAGHAALDFPTKPPVSADAKAFIRSCLQFSAADRPAVATLQDHPFALGSNKSPTSGSSS